MINLQRILENKFEQVLKLVTLRRTRSSNSSGSRCAGRREWWRK